MARNYIEDAVNVGKAGIEVASRGMLNFIDGAGITSTVADNAGTDSVDVTVAFTGAVGGMTKLFDSTLGADTASIDTGAGGISTAYDVITAWIIARTDEAGA